MSLEIIKLQQFENIFYNLKIEGPVIKVQWPRDGRQVGLCPGTGAGSRLPVRVSENEDSSEAGNAALQANPEVENMAENQSGAGACLGEGPVELACWKSSSILSRIVLVLSSWCPCHPVWCWSLLGTVGQF